MSKLIICKTCGKEKPHGGKGMCKTCYNKVLQVENTAVCVGCGETKPIAAKGLCKKCYDRKWALEHDRTEYMRDRNLYHNYGITSKEYNLMSEAQGGKCAICGKSQEDEVRETGQRLSTDHNHETDEVRELLCTQCNQGLGSFQEDSQLLIKAANYLLKWGAVPGVHITR